MTEESSGLDRLLNQLRQERDELRLQIHLAEMDARDEYDRISGKIEEVARQYEPVRGAMEETASNVISALGLAAEELQAGYRRVRKAIAKEQS